MKPQPRSISSLTVGEFVSRHGSALGLDLRTPPEMGVDRLIEEPTVNRPGLALAGFFTHFAPQRIQVLGNSERAYLESLDFMDRDRRFGDMCRTGIPMVVFSRNYAIPQELVSIAKTEGVPVMSSPLQTRHLINAATIELEGDFAPTITEYGSMVDVSGVGVLIKGASGVGKSEAVLGLIERGSSLISDDVTVIRSIEGRELSATCSDLGRSYMEVRGLGIIDVPAIFGVASIRLEKRVEMVVTLRDWSDIEEIDRIGLDQEYVEILGISVPHVTIPVRSGRDIARLVEVAALDQRLRSMGHNSALEFNEKLIKYMREKAGQQA